MALRNNRVIRSQVEQISASRADLVQAGLLPNPVLGLTLRFPVDPVSGGTFIGAQVVQSFTARVAPRRQGEGRRRPSQPDRA
jgi:hypothetical protein